MNNFGDYMLVRRVSGDATCELPKREPIIVFNKNLKDLVENTIWIKRHRPGNLNQYYALAQLLITGVSDNAGGVK
jgi:hypothetical protein